MLPFVVADRRRPEASTPSRFSMYRLHLQGNLLIRHRMVTSSSYGLLIPYCDPCASSDNRLDMVMDGCYTIISRVVFPIDTCVQRATNLFVAYKVYLADVTWVSSVFRNTEL